MAKEKKIKKSKYPEGYIGRPKPMKTKTFEFHKPTKKFWIGFAFVLAILGFLTYIVIRLVQVGKVVQPQFDYYEYNEAKQPKSYVLENNYIKFEMDPETTNFTVLQKNTGKVWYSSPEAAKSDKIALTKEKNNMMSAVLLKYSTENGNDDTYDTYTNSVQRKFYNIEKKGNEITVNYTVGQMDREYVFPLILYQSDLDKWTEGLTKSQIAAVGRAYHKYTKGQFKGADLEAMLDKYPGLEDETLYLVFENIQTHVKVQMEDIFGKQGFTYEDYLENKELYKESNIKEVPAFNISMTYKIDGNALTVTVPFSEISYRLKYPVTQVSVLPYFGAAGPDEKGYMLIPEGSGSIINFNNGKTKQNGYYADCYGWDYATERKAVITETRAAFPVFGIAYSDSSVLSIINKGAEYAGVTAEIAGKLGSYNYIRADYKLLHREQYEVTARSQSSQFVYEAGLPQDEYIEQSFIFVDSGSYVDMAKEYRNRLFAGKKKTDSKEVPLAVEIVGAIEKVQQVAGMPKVKPYKLTSYEETANIINEIDELGIKNVNYKLSGFVNGGVRQKLMSRVSFISALGGKSAFKKMLQSTEDASAKIYLDGAVQTAYRSNLFNGFNKYSDAARFVSDELCELYEYSPLWYGRDKAQDSYFLLNSKLREKGAENLLKTVAKYKVDGVSFRDNGNLLSSDFNERRLSTRATEASKQIEQFNNASEKGLGIMINGGNDYAVRSADFVTNLPLHGNKYAIIDAFVPFYEIALHGYVNYAGNPINLAYEKDQLLLESAEAGAGLQFSFMESNSERLQESNYTEYYASNFESWKEKFEEIYKEYNSKMAPVMNSPIVNHEFVGENVTKTTFENGYAVYVNFSYANCITPSGKFIPERDYRIMKVEELKKVGLMGRRAVYGYLFILPFILGFVFFMIKPLGQSLRMALSDVIISNQGFEIHWNNFANFKKAFLVDAEFNRFLVEAITQMLFQSLATIVFSFFVALLLNQKFKGRTLARSIFFLAVILSSGVLVGLESSNALMAEIQNMIEEAGNANSVTQVLEDILVSGTNGVGGVSSRVFEKVFEIIDSIYDVAMASGIQIIIFLSGLQTISPGMYEAAHMEGCTAWETLWKITVPMVSPLMLVCWIYTIIDFFMKSDNQIMDKINTQMTELLNYGFSSAMAWIYFIVCMAFIGLSSLIISKVVYNYD